MKFKLWARRKESVGVEKHNLLRKLFRRSKARNPTAKLPSQDTRKAKRTEPTLASASEKAPTEQEQPEDRERPLDRRHEAPSKGEIERPEVVGLPEPKTIRPPPLSEAAVHAAFAGAPHFSIQAVRGRHQPRASFIWDRELKGHVSDCVPPAHPAFFAATVREHLPPAYTSDAEGGRLAYDMAEVPSMLSSQGREPGSIGFEYFLELPIADSLQMGREPHHAGGAHDRSRNWELLHSSPERIGVRKLNFDMIYERLQELGGIYRSMAGSRSILDSYSPAELYTSLFGFFLMPPRFTTDMDKDPTGLEVQCATIMKTLLLDGVWYDFSLVEWRIRLGQILWAAEDPSGSTDPSEPSDSAFWEDHHERSVGIERNILIFQILLSCELYLRVDAIIGLDGASANDRIHFHPKEGKLLRGLREREIQWDLVLARRFLENLQVLKVESASPIPPKQSRFLTAPLGRTDRPRPQSHDLGAIFLPQHQARQVSGLLYFAEQIDWPSSDLLGSELFEKYCEPPSESTSGYISLYSTPLPTPRSGNSSRNGYFDHVSRPQLSRGSTQLSLQLQGPPSSSDAAGTNSIRATHTGGWLTRTYLSGLILPGESLSHFLLCTLLENDVQAFNALGDAANLYGGFVYRGRSWWSKACIVGRVMACLDDAKECMGWISVQHLPANWEEGWIEVLSQSVSAAVLDERLNRIEVAGLLEALSDPLGGRPIGEVLARDFTFPVDDEERRDQDIDIRLEKFELLPGSLGREEDASSDGRDVDGACIALLLFSTPSSGDIAEFRKVRTLYLRYDVFFVAAYPCTGPSESPISLIFSEHSHPAGFPESAPRNHPLPVPYRYTVVRMTDLMSSSFLLLQPSGAEPSLAIIDARNSPLEELFARAWCAENGEHAVVSRVGSTCLACSIRLARGLGIGVVIRVKD